MGGPGTLKVEDLEVAYGGMAQVLHGVSLEVPAGQIVALLGPNGAGKSTTLKAISGLLATERGRVTGGRVLLDGERLDGTPTDRRPTFRLTADTPEQLGDLIAEFTFHSRPAVRTAMTADTPTRRR